MGAIAPPKGVKKRKKEGKEVISYCYCGLFEVRSEDRPPPQKVSVLKNFGRENSLIEPHGLPPALETRNGAGKFPPTTPPLEFTEPHRLPPLEMGPENSTQLPPLDSNSWNLTDYPPRNGAGKLHQLPPLEFTEPHRLPPPPRNGAGKLHQLPPPPPSNSRNLTDYPPSKWGRKTPPTPPSLEIGRRREIRPPPQIEFLDPPLRCALLN